ncbi:hypothetical protein KAU25_06565, partial [Candidatus Bathyarchaeota archaeon]|nr:hypothetical protein [Candidatus Bathyarchaeota archaeon]
AIHGASQTYLQLCSRHNQNAEPARRNVSLPYEMGKNGTPWISNRLKHVTSLNPLNPNKLLIFQKEKKEEAGYLEMALPVVKVHDQMLSFLSLYLHVLQRHLDLL